MQTTKFLFVLGAAAVLASPLPSVAGPDTEAQARMREALRQKMEELNAPATPAPAPIAPPVVVEPVTPAPTPAPAPQPKPVIVEEVKPVARPATVVVPVPVEAPVVAAPAPVKTPPVAKKDPRFSDVPEDVEDTTAAKLQEAVRQKLAAEKASAPAPAPVVVAPAPPAKPAKPIVTVAAPAPVVAAPITANIETALSPLSGSKQERLAELLRRYKADAVTPQEYHTQRAKIIAEP